MTPPGWGLVLGRDQGGTRWFLDGEPVNSGVGLDLCILARSWSCTHCGGEGRDYDAKPSIEDDDGYRVFPRCPHCVGGTQAEYSWLRVRLEFDHRAGVAWAYLPAAGISDLRTEVDNGARFRWPPDRHQWRRPTVTQHIQAADVH